jgi:hypothetical protein
MNNQGDDPLTPIRTYFMPEEVRELLRYTVLPKLEAVKIFYDKPAMRANNCVNEIAPELVRLFTEFAKEVGDTTDLMLYGLRSPGLQMCILVGNYEQGKEYEVVDAVLEKLQAIDRYCAEQPPDCFDNESKQRCLQLYLDFLQQCANTAARITGYLGLDPSQIANAFGGTGKYMSRPAC